MSAPAPERIGTTFVRDEPVDASPPARGIEGAGGRLLGSRVLFALALLIAWFAVYLVGLSSLEHGRAQSALYGQLRTDLAAGTAPTGAPIAVGAPVALLEIPAAGVRAEVVVEGTAAEQLQDGPGHLPGSVLPGQQGVSVVAGRATTYGGPFGGITSLRAGDRVIATTAQGRFEYQVLGVREDGDPLPAPPAAGMSRLTLVTAQSAGGLLGDLRPAQTVYVDAVLPEGAAAPGPRAPAPAEVRLLASSLDAKDLAFLALALQLLIAVLSAAVWGWRRWSRVGAWVAGAPAVVASLWLVSSLVARLLPPLL